MKVFFDTVGCRLNQAEIERMAGQFRAAGHEILDAPEGADLVVVNTCSVTAAAASDSRQKARQAHQAGAKRILLTGCWVTLEPEKAASLVGVSDVVSNENKMGIPAEVLGLDPQEFDLEPLARRPLPGAHQRTRAFIKAQDGCDNFCTFCVTRLARGKGRSLPKEDVLRDVLLAEQGGVHEVVLTGVNLGSWGRDAGTGETLGDLLRFLLARSGVERMRLSSVEPWDIQASFFELWEDKRLCRHLHLPLQSGSAGVLRRMARHTTPDDFAKLVSQARRAIPEIALTTDIIVGFPGETEDEFSESLEFVRQVGFSGGHVFKYSTRPGTAAARIPGRIDGIEAQRRSALMRQVLVVSEEQYLSRSVGNTLEVLWEASGKPVKDGWLLHGLSGNYIKVTAKAPSNRWNLIDRVKIHGVTDGSAEGTILWQ